MVKLLQCQSTISHTTHIWVYGEANYRDFGDKHLFYILFLRSTYFHVTGGSTFSAVGVGMVPVILPGSTTLHILAPAYWTPTDRTDNLSLRTIKFSGGVVG